MANYHFDSVVANISENVEAVIRDMKTNFNGYDLTYDEKDLIFQILANLESAYDGLGDMYRGDNTPIIDNL